MRVSIVWFKRDLRVTDNMPLVQALKSGRPVIPLYVFEPDLMKQNDHSARHTGFILNALEDLRGRLFTLGLRLHTPVAPIEQVLTDLLQEFGPYELYSHMETGTMWTYGRDKRVSAWCATQGISWHEFRQNGVIRRMKSRDGWAHKWQKFMAEPLAPNAPKGHTPVGFNAAPLPKLEQLQGMHEPGPVDLRATRIEADELLDSFLPQRSINYRTGISSPLTAETSCSKLSAYFAWGLLSTKEVAQRTTERINDLKVDRSNAPRGWLPALRAFHSRLHWRCHFIQKLEDQPDLELKNMHPMFAGLRPAVADKDKLAAWYHGRTGYPFLDACMRYLHHYGWINFRMRAMIMSVASYHLWLDWRNTAPYLARLFVDYEPGIHWPQVQMQSGTTGINAVRIYNPLKQGYQQDPNGTFIRQWLPELDHVPDSFVHEPWKWHQLDTDKYPLRIFDHEKDARMARDKIWQVRRTPAFKQLSTEIAARHASRKEHRKRSQHTRKKAAQTKQQLSLL